MPLLRRGASLTWKWFVKSAETACREDGKLRPSDFSASHTVREQHRCACAARRCVSRSLSAASCGEPRLIRTHCCGLDHRAALAEERHEGDRVPFAGMLSPSPSGTTCARGKRACTAEPTLSTDNVVFIDCVAETSCRIEALHQEIAALRTDNAHTGHVTALTAAGVRERLAERDPGKPSMSWSNGSSRTAD